MDHYCNGAEGYIGCNGDFLVVWLPHYLIYWVVPTWSCKFISSNSAQSFQLEVFWNFFLEVISLCETVVALLVKFD